MQNSRVKKLWNAGSGLTVMVDQWKKNNSGDVLPILSEAGMRQKNDHILPLINFGE